MGAMASQITSLTIVYSPVFIQAQIKETIKAPRHCMAFVRGFTGDRWITRTNGQYCGKCFHLMMSSYDAFNTLRSRQIGHHFPVDIS